MKMIAAHKLKALIFIFFILTVFLLLRFSPISQYLDPLKIKELVRGTGNFGPFLFILVYGLGVCLFLPSTLFTGIGAMIFGTFYGFIYNFIGAMLGASLAFFIGRYLGRDFAASLIGNRLEKYDSKIAANGFTVTLYLRLVFFPFTPLNFGMGLTRITFRQYFWGTFWGIIAGGFAMTFFFATIMDIWTDGHWERLLDWRSIVSVILFVGSFFIPKLVQKVKPGLSS